MLVLTVSIEKHGDDESINTKNTRHDNGNNGFEKELRLENDG